MNLVDLVSQLRRERIVHGARLKPGGVLELREALRYWDGYDRRAYVLMLPEGTDLAAYRGVVRELLQDSTRELLLLCDGRRMDATGWDLNRQQLNTVLYDSQDELSEYWAKGLVAVLDRAGKASGGPQRTASQGFVTWQPLGATCALALGGLGWIVWRRNRAGVMRAQGIRDAIGAVREHFTDIMLESEVLETASNEEVQTAAVRIHEELDLISIQDGARADRIKITIARVEQLDNELGALDSRILTERRRGN